MAIIQNEEWITIFTGSVDKQIHDYYNPDVYINSAKQSNDCRILIEFSDKTLDCHPSVIHRYHLWQCIEGKWLLIDQFDIL